jgi:hypothetical protein
MDARGDLKPCDIAFPQSWMSAELDISRGFLRQVPGRALKCVPD